MPIPFPFSLCFIICHQEIQEKQYRLELNCLNVVLVFVTDVTLLRDEIVLQRIAQNFLQASK
jgi:hypothetical protein